MDGEVVDALYRGVVGDGGGLDPGAGGGLEELARLEGGGVDPEVEFGGPEGVAVGGGDGGGLVAGGAVGVDGDGDQVRRAFPC